MVYKRLYIRGDQFVLLQLGDTTDMRYDSA